MRNEFLRTSKVGVFGLLIVRGIVFSLGALLAMPAVSADLPIIAVTEITSGVDANSWREYKNSKAENFQSMLETHLARTSRFKVIERNRIDQVLGEQALQSEFSNNGTQLRVQGVDYIVYGSVTRYGVLDKVMRSGSFSTKKRVYEFGVDLRVVDALSGEIRRAETINVNTETSSGVTTQGFRSTDASADPLSDVQRKAARAAAAIITESIFPIRIIQVDQSVAYLNYGESLLSVGDEVRAIVEGKKIIDPDTGLDLGSTETDVALLRITETTDKFSKAEIVTGSIPPAGALVRFALPSTEGSPAGEQRERKGRKI